jgi:hypothetical protein
VRGTLDVPERITVEGDLLGLAEHSQVRAAVASRVFEQFDATAATVINVDKDVRKRFATTHAAVITELHLGMFHSFSLLRSQPEGTDSVIYSVLRTDEGADNGGFMLVRNQDGTVLFTNKDQVAFDLGSDEFAEALGQAQRFIEVLMDELNIPSLPRLTGRIHTDRTFKEKILKQHSKENKRYAKAAEKVGTRMRKVAKTAGNLVMEKDGLGAKKPRYLRLGLFALAMPLPFVSHSISDSVPIPRPVSVELLSAGYHAITDDAPKTQLQLVQEAFQNSSSDLPASTLTLGVTQPIEVVPNLSATITTNATILDSFVQSGSDSTDVIKGLAPVRLAVKGSLRPNECQVIPVGSEFQTGKYSLVATSKASASDLSVTASTEALQLCSTSNRTLFFDDKTFFADVEK